MRFLKLHCKDLDGPKQVTITIAGSNTPILAWVVRGKGVEVTFDANGNPVVVGLEKKYIGLNVYPAYRALQCTDPDADIFVGVSDISDDEE